MLALQKAIRGRDPPGLLNVILDLTNAGALEWRAVLTPEISDATVLIATDKVGQFSVSMIKTGARLYPSILVEAHYRNDAGKVFSTKINLSPGNFSDPAWTAIWRMSVELFEIFLIKARGVAPPAS